MKKLLALLVIGMMCISVLLAQTNVMEQGSAVSIKVNTDRNGTIQNAFATAISAAGLINDSNSSDYLLNVTITITPLDFSNNSMAYVRLDLSADLLDSNGRLLLPYAISWRQGHVNQEQAEDRAFREAVNKINAEYRSLLNDIVAAETAQSVKQGNTVGLRINADRDGIIQNAFTTALSAAGFKTDNNNSAYLLSVTITITPLAVPNVANTEFVRFDLIANLLDNNGRVLLPYSFNFRQGYANQAGAEERAFRAAASKIIDEYRNLLNDIISG